MKKLKYYLLAQISLAFIPIFFGLFFITSIVFLVKIASLTSVITITFLELLTLYLYIVPTIIFYTLPVSFVLALVISLNKLSSEYELIVITSFGLNPLSLVRLFLPISILLTLMMLIISLGLIPKSKYLTNTMMEVKKQEANFNIKESEFGQKFGDWLVYIRAKQDKEYSGIKLFKMEDESKQFILSQKAQLNNSEGGLDFVLMKGKSFIIKEDELNQINFAQMNIGSNMDSNNSEVFTTMIEYWKKKISKQEDIDNFIFYWLTSTFPILSLLLIVSLGYFNPRYEKNRGIAIAIVCTIIYYVIAKQTSKELEWHTLYLLPSLWVLFSYGVYIKRLKQLY